MKTENLIQNIKKTIVYDNTFSDIIYFICHIYHI